MRSLGFYKSEALIKGIIFMPTTHFNDVNIRGDLTLGGSGTVRLPNYATLSLPTGAEGMLAYDSTLNVVKAYQNGAWTAITNTAGTLSLDSAYNAGQSITVDGNAVALTGSHASNNAFTITHASAGSGSLVVLTGDNTGKILDIVSTADADAVLITADSVTSNDAVKINCDGLTTGSALVVESSGTLESAGTGLLALNATGLTDGTVIKITTTGATMSGGYYMVCSNGATKFSIAEDGAIVIAGTAEGTDAITCTAGDITVTDGDVTLSGGELVIVDGVTTSGAGISLTTSATTNGDGLLITADSLTTGSAIKVTSAGTVTSSGTGIVEIVTTGMTSGNALQIRVKEATMSGGKYIDCYDTTGVASVWSVGEDGNMIVAGTASGTDAITVTAGDITLSSGDLTLDSGSLTLTSGNLAVTGNITVTGNLNVTGTISYSTTHFSWTATSTTDDNFTYNAAATTAAAMVIDADTVTTGKGLHITADGATTGSALYISVTEGTLANGYYVNCYDETGSSSVFTVGENGVVVISGGTGADAITVTAGNVTMTEGDLALSDGSVTITDADNASSLVVANNTITTADLVSAASTTISTGALVKLNANTAAHDGEVLEVISAGDATATPKGVSITLSAAATGAAYGLWVDAPEGTSGVIGIGVRMDKVTTGVMLDLDAGGATMSSGWYIRCGDDKLCVVFKPSLIFGKVQRWITLSKQAIAVQLQRLSERAVELFSADAIVRTPAII